MIHQNILRYRGSAYLWWALGLIVFSFAIYALPTGAQPRNGGTWQGYLLGTLGAVLIVWLALLGIRKRRYGTAGSTVQGWASAHVYLGTALLVTATLHAAFQIGWNVHSLAYVLMCLVILSGVYGVYAYLSNPRKMARSRAGGSRESLFADLFALDAQGRRLAEACDAEVRVAVESSIARTQLGGGVWAQLTGRDGSRFLRRDAASGSSTASAPVANRDQAAVIAFVAARLPRATKRTEASNLQDLLAVLTRRQAVLRRIRRDIRLQGALKIWLYVHVPMTIALLGALVVHVVVTFLYW
ncbi:MAG: hypothetical protein HC809_10400 [Gammaproteobacteria bacterium]|nr:hypothetical protein [Gammaproteobacteria bacterium]